MKVRAIKLGIWNQTRVRAGTVFEVPDDLKLGKWMERVDEHPADPKKAAGGTAPPKKPDPKAGSQSVI
jgi:hypothetical protein